MCTRPKAVCTSSDAVGAGRVAITLRNATTPPNLEAYGVGSLCRVGADGTTELLEQSGEFRNGLAWDPDWTRLFVAQTNNRLVQVMDFEHGQLGEPRVFCQAPKGGPDGIACDSAGRLYVCGSLDNEGGDAIFIFDRDGRSRGPTTCRTVPIPRTWPSGMAGSTSPSAREVPWSSSSTTPSPRPCSLRACSRR
jgi:sugar lactone lactonase YvrE